MVLNGSSPSPSGRPTIIIDGLHVTARLMQLKSASVELNDVLKNFIAAAVAHSHLFTSTLVFLVFPGYKITTLYCQTLSQSSCSLCVISLDNRRSPKPRIEHL